MRSLIRSRLTAPALIPFILAVVAVSCGGGSDSGTPTSPSVSVPYSQTDLRVGSGAEATAGRHITVHYTGWLYATSAPDNKGQQIDSSLTPGRSAYPFTLGTGAVIRGWDQGVVGMRVGGQRRLVIPPALAYGADGRSPTVPPNATLVFDIELLEVS